MYSHITYLLRSAFIVIIFTVFSTVIPFPFITSHALAATTYYVDATNGNDTSRLGLLVNGTAWTSGYANNGLSFDGVDDFVDFGVQSDFKPPQWTVSLWVNPLSGAANYRGLFLPGYANGYTSGFLLFIDHLGRAGVRFGNGTNSVAQINNGASILNAWHHVVATFDGTTISLYVDNELKSSINASTLQYQSAASPARLGVGGGVSFFHGTLDNVGFYDRALSSQEIDTLFIRGDVSSGLIFYTPFEEGTGMVTADAAHNNGLSPNAPWKTVAKVNSTLLVPGDTVLFKKGEMWREGLIVPASGTAGNPITFGAYGSGSLPVINAASPVTNWSAYSGNTYVANVGFNISHVFVDGDYYDMAHYPNSGYLGIDTNPTDKTYLVDNDLNLTESQVTGALISVRPVSWTIDKRIVTTYDPATHRISLNSPLSWDTATGFGYFLSNKLWMLDQPKEWYYDSALGKLYIWLANNDNPNNHLIEASSIDNGIYTSRKSYITVRDFSIQKARKNGMVLTGTTNAIVENVTIASSGEHGLLVTDTATNNLLIQNNTFQKNTLTGIFFQMNGSATAVSSTLLNNTISDTGYFGDFKQNDVDAAIFINASGVTVRNNTISNSGYNGIHVSGKNNTLENNFINMSCLVLDDCGGIYGGRNITSEPSNNKILGNIVTDSIGNYAGTPTTNSQAEGIYLDDYSKNYTVSNNTVTNTAHGLFIHNGDSNTLANNTVYGARDNALWIKEDTLVPTAGITTNNVVTGNILFNNPSAAANARFDGLKGYVDFGMYNNNIYSSNYHSYPISQRVTNTTTNYALSQWQTSSGKDALSKDIGTFYQTNAFVPTPVGGSVVANGSFDANILSWNRWSADSSATTNWTSSCGLDGGCLGAFTTNTGGRIYSGLFALQTGKTYQVSWSVRSDTPHTGSVVVLKGNTPYTLYGTKDFTMNTDRQNLTFTFTASQSLSDARIDFVTSEANTHYWIDNVSLKEVSLVTNDPADDMVLHYNPTQTSRTISLPAQQYVDVNNQAVSGSFTLPPYSSKILLATYNNNDRVCNNRETNQTAPNDCPTPTSTPTPTPPSSGGGSGGGGVIVTTPPVAGSGITTPLTPTGGTSSRGTISRRLVAGLSGDDVRLLQEILVAEGLLSGNNVTGYFGPKTFAALQVFQVKYGIVSSGTAESTGYGAAGPVTRAKLNERLGLLPGVPATSILPTVPTTGTFTRVLYIGLRRADVKLLQEYLITKGYLAPGNNTGFFGKLTETAVKSYQRINGLEQVGSVGPKTRELLNAGK